jgi:hypothetical protein
MNTETSVHTPVAHAHRLILALLAVALAALAALAGPAGALPRDDIDHDPPGTPGPDDPPAQPAILVGGRTSTTIALTLVPGPPGASHFQLTRSGTGGPASVLSGSVGGAEFIDHVDTGLVPDGGYCYQVDFTYSGGVHRKASACHHTTLDEPVTRMQVQLTTAGVGDADTDGSVRFVAGGGSTYLDHDRDDFERGDTHVYDVDVPADRSDLRRIELRNESDDGWCVTRMTLLVNTRDSFDKSFAGEPGGCLWLETDGTVNHVVELAEIRANPSWGTWAPPLPDVDTSSNPAHGRFPITDAELEQRVEGIVGDAIHGTVLQWFESGTAVQAENHPTRSNVRHVRVVLEGDVTGPNATTTLDFDLVFSAGQSAKGEPIRIGIADEAFRVHSTGSWGDDDIEDGVRSSWPGVDMAFEVDVDALLLRFLGPEEAAPYLGQCCDDIQAVALADGTMEISANLSKKLPSPCELHQVCTGDIGGVLEVDPSTGGTGGTGGIGGTVRPPVFDTGGAVLQQTVTGAADAQEPSPPPNQVDQLGQAVGKGGVLVRR